MGCIAAQRHPFQAEPDAAGPGGRTIPDASAGDCLNICCLGDQHEKAYHLSGTSGHCTNGTLGLAQLASCAPAQVLVSPDLAAIPRTQIHFDFDLERRLLAEGELGTIASPAQVYSAHQAHQ